MSGYKLQLNGMTYLQDVNRVEVIDGSGRVYVNRNDKNVVEVSLQDSGRTLKVFINTAVQVEGSATLNLVEAADDLATKELYAIMFDRLGTSDEEIVEDHLFMIGEGDVQTLRKEYEDDFNALYDHYYNYLLKFKS